MLLHKLPEDILVTLFCLCDLKDLLRIEQTCRRLRDLASTQQIWLLYLRRLDQAHAPNLPYHVDVHSLKSEELRTMVIRAVQAHDNWRNGTFGENARSRDIHIELNDPPPAHLVHPGGKVVEIARSFSGPKVTLFPGGDYLLVQWTHGFVQLVDIEARKAIWTYPPLPSAQTDMRLWSHKCLCYDVSFQANDYANVVVAYWKLDSEDGYSGLKELIIEVFRISLANQEVNRLYSRTENAYPPRSSSITIEGDLLSLHSLGSKYSPERNFSLLVIIDFVKDQNVLARIPLTDEYLLDFTSQKMKIVLGHLFLSCIHPSNSPLLRVLDIRHALTVGGISRRISFTDSEAINVDELGIRDIYIELPIGYESEWLEVALPSLCSFHWKEERERYDQLTVEIPAKELRTQCCGWFINCYTLSPRTSYGESPMLSLVSSSKVFPSPSPSYDKQRLSRFIPCSLSGRSIMLHLARDIGENRNKNSFVLTTINESDTYTKYPQSQTSSSIRTVSDFQSRCGLDYLSSAIITYEGKRQITIAYPA